MKKTLKLQRRGCDYFGYETPDDIGNHRVGSYDNTIQGKDGNTYILEFGHMDIRRTRTTHKITGKPLKHPITEIVKTHALHVDTQFDKKVDGFTMSFRNLEIEKAIYHMGLDYTQAGILAAVNFISKDTYTAVEWVE